MSQETILNRVAALGVVPVIAIEGTQMEIIARVHDLR